MTDQIILTVAEAVLANTKVLQSLVDALPHETRAAVAEKVQAVPTPVAPVAPAPVVAPVAPVAPAPVVAAPVPTPTPAPTPAAPAVVPAAPAAPAPVTASPSNVPFSDGPGLIAYTMESYKALGAAKGAQIQAVLAGLGYSNINDIRPDHYGAFYAQVEALKG